MDLSWREGSKGANLRSLVIFPYTLGHNHLLLEAMVWEDIIQKIQGIEVP